MEGDSGEESESDSQKNSSDNETNICSSDEEVIARLQGVQDEEADKIERETMEKVVT